LLWLELITETQLLENELLAEIYKEGTEILKMIKSIILTKKENMNS